jgi:sigma-B regulation protein RsbU (phosphoserine phosphatase)
MADHTIFVVEDERTLRRLLEYRLGKKYEVHTAADGDEALEQIQEILPDLIVSDVMMPNMDGFALQEALQDEKKTRTIPFIFLTAKADNESRQRGERMGVDDYITKPLDIEQLLSRIERLLERTSMFQSQLGGRIGQDFSSKLMPTEMPSEPGYRANFFNSPREHGGGDLFDWMRTDDGAYIFTIGDVMGKGVQAKFYAFSFLSYVRGTLRAMLPVADSLAALMSRVNELLLQDEVMEETFASLLLLHWKPNENTLTYVNAGHCRPVLTSSDDTAVIEHSDVVLGLEPDAAFRDTTVEIPPGSAFVAYTDAILEQRPEGTSMKEIAGEKGVKQACAAALRAATDKPIEYVLRKILEQTGTEEFHDDILVFWLERQ